MVTENDLLAPLPYQRQALAGVGPIADHIPEAVEGVDFLLIDILKHRRECLEVAVDIADDGELHRYFPAVGSASNGWMGAIQRAAVA